VAVPFTGSTSRTRQTIIRVQHLHRPPTEKHDTQKLELEEPETEVEAEMSVSASPIPACDDDWKDVLTRETMVEGQVCCT